jgi:hypothetical protein
MSRSRSDWVSATVSNMREFAGARDDADELVLQGDASFRRKALRDLGIRTGGGVGGLLSGMFHREEADPYADMGEGGIREHVATILRAFRITINIVVMLGFLYFIQAGILFYLNSFWLRKENVNFWPGSSFHYPVTAALAAIAIILIVSYISLRVLNLGPKIERNWMVVSKAEGKLVLRRIARTT